MTITPEVIADVRVLMVSVGDPYFPPDAPGRMYLSAYEKGTGAFVVLDAPVAIGNPSNVWELFPQYRPYFYQPNLPSWCDGRANGYRAIAPALMLYKTS